MGRKSATVEFLERLVALAGGRAEFKRRTGIKASNLSDYLRGKKRVGWDRLGSATHQVCGEPPAFVALVEQWDLWASGDPPKAQVGDVPGVYALFDSAHRCIYFGKATNLYTELRQTLNRTQTKIRTPTGASSERFRDLAAYASVFEIVRGDGAFVKDVESLVLRCFRNLTLNSNFGKFERHE
jgi:hypothetical protein